MVINIEKRTRTSTVVDGETIYSAWSAWSDATDTAPFTNTDTVEYRTSKDVEISIKEVTNNVVTDEDNIVSGDGNFDDLMETATKHLEAQYTLGRITGNNYAMSYTSIMNNLFNQSIQFTLSKPQAETAKINKYVAEETAANKISVSDYKTMTEEVNKDIAVDTKQFKINQVEEQVEKMKADTDYVNQQNTQLVRSVRYNNRVKAIDSLSDTYGTFGAGGITVSEDQWAFYYKAIATLISDLNDYVGDWDASAGNFVYPTEPKEGDFYVVSAGEPSESDGDKPVDGTYGSYANDGTDETPIYTTRWRKGDIIVYLGERWALSDVTLPSSTEVTLVTDSTV